MRLLLPGLVLFGLAASLGAQSPQQPTVSPHDDAPGPTATTQAPAPKHFAMPLADAIKTALEKSSLTAPGSHPFHVRLEVRDVLHPESARHATIEIFWNSPTFWKRIVTAPGLEQTVTHNATGEHFETAGEYFPQWLSNFVTALTDPVPAGIWNRPGLEVLQYELRPGALSTPCADLALSFAENSAVPARLCFLPSKAIASIAQPGYQMEFGNYQRFQSKTVPYLYLTFSGDTLLAGKITTLESSNKKDDFFTVAPTAATSNSLASIMPSFATVQKLVRPPAAAEWPAVTAGKTEGSITAMASVDQKGSVREITILRSANPQLNAAAVAQLQRTGFQPVAMDNHPVQIGALIVLPFSTKEDAAATVPTPDVPLPGATVADHAIATPSPQYPLDARNKHITGAVTLFARIDRAGAVADAQVIDSPSDSMTAIALATVKQWKYVPFAIEGVPVEAATTITVNFTFQ